MWTPHHLQIILRTGNHGFSMVFRIWKVHQPENPGKTENVPDSSSPLRPSWTFSEIGLKKSTIQSLRKKSQGPEIGAQLVNGWLFPQNMAIIGVDPSPSFAQVMCFWARLGFMRTDPLRSMRPSTVSFKAPLRPKGSKASVKVESSWIFWIGWNFLQAIAKSCQIFKMFPTDFSSNLDGGQRGAPRQVPSSRFNRIIEIWAPVSPFCVLLSTNLLTSSKTSGCF